MRSKGVSRIEDGDNELWYGLDGIRELRGEVDGLGAETGEEVENGEVMIGW